MRPFLDAVGREVRVGDFILYYRTGTARLHLARVLEIRKVKKDDLPHGSVKEHASLEVRIQGAVRGKVGDSVRLLKPAWLWPDWHSTGHVVRLEPCQVPELECEAFRHPHTPTKRADLEREQQSLLRRLTEIDAEMERCPGDDESHITTAEVFAP